MQKFLSFFFAVLFLISVLMFWTPYMAYAFLSMIVSLALTINFAIDHQLKNK